MIAMYIAIILLWYIASYLVAITTYVCVITDIIFDVIKIRCLSILEHFNIPGCNNYVHAVIWIHSVLAMYSIVLLLQWTVKECFDS